MEFTNPHNFFKTFVLVQESLVQSEISDRINFGSYIQRTIQKSVFQNPILTFSKNMFFELFSFI